MTTPIEELHQWLGVLRQDLQDDIESRHLLATARVCTLLIERLETADPARPEPLRLAEVEQLEEQLAGLQHAIVRRAERRQASKTQKPSWQPRVLSGGKEGK